MAVTKRADRSNSLPPTEEYYENNHGNDYKEDGKSSDVLCLTKFNLDNLESKCSPSVSSSLSTDDSGFGNLPCQRDFSDLPSVSSGMSKDEFLVAMSEDLSEWLIKLYPDLCCGLNYENFFDVLSTGLIICHHAQILQAILCQYKGDLKKFKSSGTLLRLPRAQPTFSTRNLPKDPGSLMTNGIASSALFVSRDNLSNFITWARELGLNSSLLFETEDLIGKKNLRNFVLCLMEIARIGGKFGIAIPEIINLEAEIECELSEDKSLFNVDSDVKIISKTNNDPSMLLYNKTNLKLPVAREKSIHNPPHNTTASSKYMNAYNRSLESTVKPEVVRPDFDLKSLDEIVRDVLSKCTCKKMFPMIRLSEGRYRFGNKSQIIFVRILRNHVMVRVGGGWDTLNDFLNKHDECRKHKSTSQNTSSNNNNDDNNGSKREHFVEHFKKSVLPTAEESPSVSPVRKSRSRSVTKSITLDVNTKTNLKNPTNRIKDEESKVKPYVRRYSEVRKAPTPRFRKKSLNPARGPLNQTQIPLPTQRPSKLKDDV